MILKEIQILSEALWESVQTDLKFFSPIQLFVKKLSELTYSEIEDIGEARIYINKIDTFFDTHRHKLYRPLSYITPVLIEHNNDSVVKMVSLIKTASTTISSASLAHETKRLKAKPSNSSITNKNSSGTNGKIFIGHGRSKLWARVQLFIKDDLVLSTLTFEDESRTSESIITILSDFLNEASFAILIMTAEDETTDGNIRARQNVIHEAGLFQGRLGFEKVIILKQDMVEGFSNIAGLLYIPFTGENIEQTFYELQRKLKKLAILK